MNRIAKFHKVSFHQFEESWKEEFPDTLPEEIQEIYDGIELPRRATKDQRDMISSARWILI